MKTAVSLGQRKVPRAKGQPRKIVISKEELDRKTNLANGQI